MSSLPNVSIIVLNWNSQSFLNDCLQALQQLDYPSYSITVVDNASSDDSVAFVESRFPEVKLIQNSRNMGYGGGNNVALRQSAAQIVAEFAVIINPDVVVEREWLRALIAPMVQDPSIGIAGSKLLYPDSQIIQHAGGYITQPQAFPGHYGLGEIEKGQCDEERDVDYVIGAAIALRRSMLDRIGDFDEGFFLYFEEADLCRRARNAGFRVVYVPDARATHFEAATTEKESAFYLKQIHSGRWRYLLKHTAPSELLEETLPAERDWLCGRSAREWQALAVAYRNALHQMPEIWQTRRREAMDVDTLPTEEEEQAVEAGVAALAETVRTRHGQVRTTTPSALEAPDLVRWSESDTRLQTKSYVVEQPFTSQTPIIGPLITWLRTVWNNIATTWYVRPLLQQQNDYNYQVWQRLNELRTFQVEMHETIRDTHAVLADFQTQVDDLTEWLIESDRDTTRLARQSGELAYRLVQIEDRLAAFGRQPASPPISSSSSSSSSSPSSEDEVNLSAGERLQDDSIEEQAS